MCGLGAVCGVFSCCLDGNFVCIRSLGSLLPPLCSFLCFFAFSNKIDESNFVIVCFCCFLACG